MLRVHQISKSYGIQPVLQDISFTLNRGERLALVGPNGCGKTTLLRIITGQEPPDRGSVTQTVSGLRIGYLPQGLAPAPEDTLGSFLGLSSDGVPALAAEVERLAAALALLPAAAGNGAAHAAERGGLSLQQQFDAALERLQWEVDLSQRAPKLLAGLGLAEIPLDTPARILSGGQKTRLALASVLLSEPQLLLLDEPTNHLDLDMLDWLEGWLRAFSGALLIVSHDRAFLDQTATSILELDDRSHTSKVYAGNYAAYLEQKQAEIGAQRQAYQDQLDEIARLQAAAAHIRGIARFRKGGKADTGDKFAKGFFANRGKETVRKAKQIEARIEHLQTDGKIEKPQPAWQMKLEFAAGNGGSRDVLVLEELAVGYTRPLLSDIHLTLRHGARAALLGPNGCGKTTLLRTIAGRLPPLAGRLRLGSSVRLGYMTQEQEDLDPALNALQTIQRQAGYNETEARSYLHRFLFSGDEVFTPVGSLSYGERARLNLACLSAAGCNFLLLDEPLNHLDIPARVRFEQALSGFEGTILAVVHDRYFLAGFADQIFQVENGKLALL